MHLKLYFISIQLQETIFSYLILNWSFSFCFLDMYFHLEQEEDNSVVRNFLQDLMETEVLDFGIMENLKLDSDLSKKKWRDPSITMEVRHKQVKENRVRKDAELDKLRKEKEALREAREEAWRLEQEKQRKRRQQARRQEELIQQEMIRLRREMEEKRSVEQLARNMYNKHKCIWTPYPPLKMYECQNIKQSGICKLMMPNLFSQLSLLLTK